MAKWKTIGISVIVSVIALAIASYFSTNAKEVYATLELPALAPPPILFAIVWPILYGLMGVSLYYVLSRPSKLTTEAVFLFFAQLALNLIWPFLFFVLENNAAALGILVLLWAAVVMMIQEFYTIYPKASYLQIPYLLWITYAVYLNFWIFYHN